jgi:succinyl-diaminopimelate desuccinylase
MGAVMDQFEKILFPSLKTKRTNMPVVPDGAKESTININSIHGGLDEGFDGLPSPLVPDSCRMVLDRRFLIEEDIDDVKNEIRQILEELATNRPSFKYQLRDLFEVTPTMTPQNAPVVREVSAAIQEILGKPAEMVVSPGTYDQKHIYRIGKLNNCIAYGPGILDLAHQPDEYVDIDDMLDSAKVMALSAYNLLQGN